MEKTKILIIFGTRPEAIKLAPVIKEFARQDWACQIICVTGQHREMLDQVLKIFEIKPDYDLEIMEENQSLFDICINSLRKLRKVLEVEKPDLIIVQGDTTTAFIGVLSAYYLKIPVAHVEAGLRTHNKYGPFPEEINRVLIDHIADLCFAPTEYARENLRAEGIPSNKIFVTGNTVIDALLLVLERLPQLLEGKKVEPVINPENRLILVTGHRRESFGKGFEDICNALREIVIRNPDVEIVYPVHMNPNVREPVNRILGGISRIHLIEPVDYPSFVDLMNRSYLILTDSGGVQEEAPSLGKPVLVMRKDTERPEGIEAGVARLVGSDKDSIVTAAQKLLDDRDEYEKMARAVNPYGDGKARLRIVEIIKRII